MSLNEAAKLVGAPPSSDDPRFIGCSTDSRTLHAGNLFIALEGPSFDGHAFVDAAQHRGAVAAMVARAGAYPLPAIRVADTLTSLTDLAAAWRRRSDAKVIAVTGSNGKTTVKELIASIVRMESEAQSEAQSTVLATRGNLNNHIGVPLTLLELGVEHQHAIIEMGANHPGEIASLASIARPSIGVVTHCGAAHLEGFGSIEGVARAKGELFESLIRGGTAIINADDEFAPLWRSLAGTRAILTFGLDQPADVQASWRPGIERNAIELSTPLGPVHAALALPGRHNVANTAAAAAASIAAGVSLPALKAGIEAMRPVRGRMQLRKGAAGARIIDDTYNANPSSLEAALEVLASAPGVHHLVLGDMAELGPGGADHHLEAGKLARALGVDRLWTTGALSEHATAAFGSGARHFDAACALGRALRQELAPDMTILVKGSRSMAMERVVDALVERDGTCC